MPAEITICRMTSAQEDLRHPAAVRLMRELDACQTRKAIRVVRHRAEILANTDTSTAEDFRRIVATADALLEAFEQMAKGLRAVLGHQKRQGH